jgi:hypothetical protein
MVRHYEKLWKKTSNDSNFSIMMTPQIILSIIRESIKKVIMIIDTVC